MRTAGRARRVASARPRGNTPRATKSLKDIARRFKQELSVYRLVLKDPRTPLLSKILLGLAVAYLALPFDLIPDFIPVLGQLDDLLIVPFLVYLAVRFIPPGILAEHRATILDKDNPLPAPSFRDETGDQARPATTTGATPPTGDPHRYARRASSALLSVTESA